MGENAPPPEGWVCDPHAWNAVACCPPACMTTVEVRDALTRLDGTTAAALSLITGLSIAEIDELGGLGEN